MTPTGAVVLRPEPGNAETAARLAALGIAVRRCPLFAVRQVDWLPPDPGRYDALMLTSANAVRHAGPGLRELGALPALAVGAATATAARDAGLTVAITGDRDAAALVEQARARGFNRLLHLTGRDRVPTDVDAVTIYASYPVPVDAATVLAWEGRVALLHSARAARRFAALVDERGLPRPHIGVAALSKAVAAAAGEGWAVRAVAGRPEDGALVAAVAALIDPCRPPTDKRWR